MSMKTDLLVIGGGMAGLVAGILSAESGLKTILLRKGQSATAYSSGAIDVIGYLPNTIEQFSSIEEGLIALAGLYPLHPYSVFGYNDDVAPENIVDNIIERVKVAITWLKNHLEGTEASLIGEFNSILNPISILGTTKPTCLIQETMNLGDLYESEDSVLLFAGIAGYPDFNPSTAAKTFLEDRMAMGQPPHKVGHCLIQIRPFDKSFNLSAIEIARHLEHECALDELAAQLKAQAERIGATHIALPPILGVRNPTSTKSRLEELLKVSVFELLSFPPSVPGLRLQHALEMVFVKSGGKMLAGHAAQFYTKTNRRVTSVTAKSPRRELRIDAKAYILATGKYIGGGIAGNENGFRETVFDIMTVTGDYHKASEIIPSRATRRLSISPLGHPLQSCGMSIDPRFRPVDEDGIEWAENVFAAGAVLAGYNYAVEKSGLGVALTSGYNAATNAIEYIKELGQIE